MINKAIQYKLKLLEQNLFDLAVYSLEDNGIQFQDITDEQCDELVQKALNAIYTIMDINKKFIKKLQNIH